MTFYQIKKIVFRFMPPPLDQINGQWTIVNYKIWIILSEKQTLRL